MLVVLGTAAVGSAVLFLSGGAGAAPPVTCTPQSGYASCLRVAYTGADQTLIVPPGVSSLRVQAWGAGGGGGNLPYYDGQTGGGGGGYSVGRLAVTAGEKLVLRVGEGGKVNSDVATYGGGGAGGHSSVSDQQTGASGGGYSGVFAAGQPLILAGGGGGTSPGADTVNPASGGGGGLVGGEDGVPEQSGRGGSQTAGGAGATNTGCDVPAKPGTYLHGGAGASMGGEAGGGGGGGYYGGGGGSCQPPIVQIYNGDGGGGSGYFGGVGVSGASTSAGSNAPGFGAGGAAAATGDSEYVAGVGQGGAFDAGGNGLIVLQYTARPNAALSFTPSTIGNGATSVLRIRLINANTSGTFTAAVVVDHYPAGVRNAANPHATTTCVGGSVRATAAAGSVALTGATIPAGHCDVFVHVTSTSAGRHVDTLAAGALTTSNGGRSDAGSTAALHVLPPAPTVGVTFAPAAIGPGETSTLTISLANAGGSALGGVSFAEQLPAGLTFASPADTQTTCGGTVTAHGNTLKLTGGRIPLSGCTVSVVVTASRVDTFTAVVPADALTTASGVTNANRASAMLKVAEADAVSSTGIAVGTELTVGLGLLVLGAGLMLGARRRS